MKHEKRLDLNALRTWLATKDPNERYIYGTCTECALAQFLHAQHPNSFILVGAYDCDVWLGHNSETFYRDGPEIDITYTIPDSIVNTLVDCSTWGQLATAIATVE